MPHDKFTINLPLLHRPLEPFKPLPFPSPPSSSDFCAPDGQRQEGRNEAVPVSQEAKELDRNLPEKQEGQEVSCLVVLSYLLPFTCSFS